MKENPDMNIWITIARIILVFIYLAYTLVAAGLFLYEFKLVPTPVKLLTARVITWGLFTALMVILFWYAPVFLGVSPDPEDQNPEPTTIFIFLTPQQEPAYAISRLRPCPGGLPGRSCPVHWVLSTDDND